MLRQRPNLAPGGVLCIKMVDISSKSLGMVIDFPYLKYDKSQDLKVYYSAIK